MIRIRNANKYYNRGKSNELHVLKDISLELPEKGMIAIFGRSGCGKTTLLNVIGGLDTVASGEVFVKGESLRKNTDVIRNRDIGYVFQNYNLNNKETVYENVADALRLCGVTDEKEIERRVLAALRNVDMELYQRRMPDTLSGGQQQRIAVARAIVKRPAIILADEPTGNLDESNTVMIMDMLKAISKKCLVLLVTHEVNLVDYYCDRVIELSDGEIKGIRENTDTVGFAARDKNHIYLGELPCRKERVEGVNIEYYGESTQDIRLKIVSVNGKLYLQSDTPAVRVLDSTSEIKLREGVFAREEKSREARNREAEMTMDQLPPIVGSHFGRLFSFKKALLLSLQDNFRSKKKKSGRFFRFCLFFMAVVLVFMTASSAISLKQYEDIKKSVNQNILAIPFHSKQTDLAPLMSAVGQHGIVSARHADSKYITEGEDVEFSLGKFQTVEGGTVTVNGLMMSEAYAEGLILAAGGRVLTGATDILITTALADDIISVSPYSYINGYDSTIGLTGTKLWNELGYFHIVGVVESSDHVFFLKESSLAYDVMQEFFPYLNVAPEWKIPNYDGDIKPGEILFYCNGTYDDYEPEIGETMTLLGKEFTASEIYEVEPPPSYLQYVYEQYGTELENQEVYGERLVNEGLAEDMTQARYMWFWNYYFAYYSEYCQQYVNDNPYRYMAGFHCTPAALCQASGYGQEMYAGYHYKEEYGHFPSESDEDFLAYYMTMYNNGVYRAELDALFDEFGYACDQYRAQHRVDFKYRYFISDEDYASLMYSFGAVDERISYDNYYGTNRWTVLVHSDDMKETLSYLSSYYDEVLTPDDVLQSELSEFGGVMLADVVGIGVVLLLMCLCVFFIMRSSLMSRVKEVGIYRAIGVSKKNLVFRFFVESLVLFALTVLVGFICSAAVITWLTSVSFLSDMLYLPVSLGLAILAVMLAASIAAGLLPLLLLMRKTPSAILAKYDI